MTSICFAPLHNTAGKHDATGAFQPEAREWAYRHDCEVVLIDNSKKPAAMRAEVLEHLANVPVMTLERVAFFCHGWSTGIQFGFNLGNLDSLVSTLASVACSTFSHPFIVPMFCCSTGASSLPGGDGGFADTLRDELCRAGVRECRIDAHTTAGHCSRNPYVRRFEGQGSAYGGTGGLWIVAPGSLLWSKWREKLASEFRWWYSDYTLADIHAEVAE